MPNFELYAEKKSDTIPSPPSLPVKKWAKFVQITSTIMSNGYVMVCALDEAGYVWFHDGVWQKIGNERYDSDE